MFCNIAESTWRLPFSPVPIFLLCISGTLPYSPDCSVNIVEVPPDVFDCFDVFQMQKVYLFHCIAFFQF